MLEQGIIIQNSSPWMAPAVFVPKKSGDLRICIDYRELNKQTTKDAYPLPLPDEIQDHLYSRLHNFLHAGPPAGADSGGGLWGLETPPPEIYQGSQKNDVLV